MKGPLLAALIAGAGALAQAPIDIPLNHPVIQYETRTPSDPVEQLNARLSSGGAQLVFEPGRGYLRSVLEALDVPADSQVLVFSKTSLQAALITPVTPRAVYFNDRVAVAWIPDAPLLELAAHDAEQGVIFYALEQARDRTPLFRRNATCLECHVSDETRGVPGIGIGSVHVEPDGMPVRGGEHRMSDHRTPFASRWGGWLLTGAVPLGPHLARPLAPGTQTSRYLTPHSDAVALMVLEHQSLVTNLLTRLGWVVRAAGESTGEAQDLIAQLVDALVFAGEPPLPRPVRGPSPFTSTFAALGPRDPHGRTLRAFDLETRLMRYPCSFMIYSPAFDALPGTVKAAVYSRLGATLAALPNGSAAWEIVRATKNGVP